jgi:adenylate cyclase
MTLRDYLLSQGVAGEEITQAESRGDEAVPLLAIDHLLVPGPVRYTQGEVVEKAGIELEEARRLWRAMGFPDVPADERAFSDADVEALSTLRQLIDQGVVDPEVALQLARVFGQSLARMSDAEINALRHRIEQPLRAAGASDAEVAEAVTTVLTGMLPTIEGFVLYTWRRQLAAAARRSLFVHDSASGQMLTVGFADLVGFTALSQQVDDHDLATIVDRFETAAYDTIAALGGRVVKMIGDEVMFVAEDVAAGARIALSLAEVYGDDETLPDVRVGLARGPVLSRGGDYFGATVNLASRIVNIAYAGTAVASDEIHQALEGDPAFEWKALVPRRLKGIGWTTLWVVMRPGEGSSAALPLAVVRRMQARRSRRRAKAHEGDEE